MTIKSCIMSAVLAVAAPAASQAAVPDAALQWEARGAGSVQTATVYNLFNTKNNSRIGYDNRTFGVDLGWVSDGGQFEFRRDAGNVRDHRHTPISETENVSIYNTKTRRYLKYYRRGE